MNQTGVLSTGSPRQAFIKREFSINLFKRGIIEPLGVEPTNNSFYWLAVKFIDYRTGTHTGSTVCFDYCAQIRFMGLIPLSYSCRFYKGLGFAPRIGQKSVSPDSSSSTAEKRTETVSGSGNIRPLVVRFPGIASSEALPIPDFLRTSKNSPGFYSIQDYPL